MSQNFFSISREKLLEYYPHIIENSDKQFYAGLELSKNGDNGMAISHILISTEELVKALIVVLDSKGFKFREVKGMDIFFRNHEIRYFMGFLVFIFSIFGDDLIKKLKELKSDPEKANILLTSIHDENTLNKNLKYYLLRKIIFIKSEMKWFSKAEIFRQNGFYVDMKNELISPLHLTIEEFNEAKKRIEKTNHALKMIIETFISKDIEISNLITDLQNQSINQDIYLKIENQLSNIRKSKKTFFETFGSVFLSGIKKI